MEENEKKKCDQSTRDFEMKWRATTGSLDGSKDNKEK